MIDPALTVAEVLHAYPQAERVFITLGTSCVGCYLMSFCTLREVADQYELPLETVMQEISKEIPDQTQCRPQQNPIYHIKRGAALSEDEHHETSI